MRLFEREILCRERTLSASHPQNPHLTPNPIDFLRNVMYTKHINQNKTDRRNQNGICNLGGHCDRGDFAYGAHLHQIQKHLA